MLRWFRRQNEQPTDPVDVDIHEFDFLCAISEIPFENWKVEERNCPDIWAERRIVDQNQLENSLIYDHGGCKVEFFRDMKPCLWCIVVNEIQVYYGSDRQLEDLWSKIFQFIELGQDQKKYAIAAQAIRSSLQG